MTFPSSFDFYILFLNRNVKQEKRNFFFSKLENKEKRKVKMFMSIQEIQEHLNNGKIDLNNKRSSQANNTSMTSAFSLFKHIKPVINNTIRQNNADISNDEEYQDENFGEDNDFNNQLKLASLKCKYFESPINPAQIQYDCAVPIARNTPENNQVKLIDYRQNKIASFTVDGKELLCLPQAFEIFLKNLVGGLHTVYTKLKRLDITPIVCNVEQVNMAVIKLEFRKC